MSEVTKIEEVKDLTEEQNTPQVPEKQEIQEQSGKAGKAKKVVARDAQTFLNRVTLLAAFLLPFLAMLAILVFNGVYPFGTKTMLDSDMYHQYMPFLKEYVKMVRAGQSIDYSWKVGIGSNFLALYIYYLASPTNWLVFLVPEKFIIEFMSFFVIVKIGLAGFTSCLFLRSRATSEQNPVMVAYGSLVASVFYAMSGFMAAYNWNVMWLDCVVLFPLILIALHRLVFKGKMGLYVITLGLCIYTNFYISIMICLFLVIYFIYLFIMEKRSFSMVWKFALGSLLAGGLAAIMLVPVVRALMATDFGDMVFPKNWKVYFPILDVLARHCMAIKTERALAHWPNIYSGVLTFLLVPMYAVNEKISAKKRFGTLAIEGILLICFCTNFLDYIWHGLNYPDSLPARQSFIYVLFMVMMCYECFVHWDGVNKGMILRVYLGSVAFLLFIEKFVDVDDFAPWTWHLNFAFITFYAICMYLFKTKKGKTIYVLAGLVLLVTMAEATGNMLYTSVGVTKRTDATKLMDDYNTLYERNLAKTQEEGFQRYDKIFHVTKNDGVYGSYPSASVFSSTLNSYVMDLYTKIGLQYSKVYYGASGITPLTAAMLNLKYIYLESDQWENEMLHLIDQENEVYLYEMNYSLPFGYVAPKGFDLPDGVNDYGVTLLNKLAKDLGAYDAMLVKEDTKEDGDDVIFTVPKDGIYYGYTTNHGTGKIKMIGGGKEDTSYKDLRKGVLFYLGSLEADQQYTFTNGDSKDDTKKISMAIYRLNLDAAEIAINTLKKQSMTDVVIDNCSVSGKLELEEAGRLILSIPVDEGWTVWVNGVETEPASFGNALIALDLEPGSYDIRLEFEASGKIMGRVISAITLVIVMLLFGLPFLRERLGKKKEAESEKS